MSESQIALIRRIAKEVVYEVLEDEKLLEPAEFWDYLNAVDAGVAAARQRAKERKSLAVREEIFSCLSWEKQTGNRIGEFEVADNKNNVSEKFEAAFNILQENNATISNRYYGKNYQFTYWSYQEKIYRQHKTK